MVGFLESMRDQWSYVAYASCEKLQRPDSLNGRPFHHKEVPVIRSTTASRLVHTIPHVAAAGGVLVVRENVGAESFRTVPTLGAVEFTESTATSSTVVRFVQETKVMHLANQPQVLYLAR